MLKRILSFTKSIIVSIGYLLMRPILLFFPKYSSYIFVLTTGRSGSGTLANLMKNSNDVNSFHEPYPILNNSFEFKSEKQGTWVKFQFYFIKYPKILFSRMAGKSIYLETNHLFLKSFSKFCTKVFKGKINVIHLRRSSFLVAKSMYEIGKIPGGTFGNKWYLNPSSETNLIPFDKVLERTNDPGKEQFVDLYKCIWYWHEMEARIDQFKKSNVIPTLEIDTSELNDISALTEKINSSFKTKITPFTPVKVDKNLKVDEKKITIDLEVVKSKDLLFQTALID